MTDLAGDIHRLRREFLGRLDDGFEALGKWRERARAAYEEVEAREAAEAGTEETDGVPDGAPPQYAAVQARVERGEYTWFDVMAGNVEDPDARKVHMWLDARIELISRAWREMERGASADEAVDRVSGELERESRTGG